MTANWFAYSALLAWPLVSISLYRTQSVGRATILTILGAFLLLPAEIIMKVETIPALDKTTIPNVCALLGCLLLSRRKRVRGRFGIFELLAITYITSPFLTSVVNGDPVVAGTRIIPGVDYYDGISAVLSQILAILPFFIGRHYLQRVTDGEDILRILSAAGLVYSLPMLFEIRMSPQLSNLIYGYFPSSFSTEGRYGGFRPVVFMSNGLAVAFFTMTALLASLSLWRAKVTVRIVPAATSTPYLAVVLVLCKTLGVLVYTIVAAPLIGLAKPKTCVRVAALLVSIGLLYPLLRIENVFPDKFLVAFAEKFSEERANSLLTRFEQEQQLLERSSERPILGWGRFGRSRVYDEYGKDLSLTDGQWIITLGQFGIVGFIAQFGLLALPVLRALAALKFVETAPHRLFFCTLALIVSFGLVEQLPNASLSAWSWLLAGSLLGTAEHVRQLSRLTKTGRPQYSSKTLFAPQSKINI
jgi:hypothetical protein